MDSQGLNPEKLLELSGSYWKVCVLHAAVKLDVFTAIGKAPLRSEEIAQKINGDRRAVTMLLNALVAMGLLEKRENIFSNTVLSREALSRDSPHYVGYMIMHHQGMMGSWNHLDKAVKTGTPLRAGIAERGKEELENFLLGMFNMAMNLAPRLVKAIDISGRERLLDLGGGPGTYAVYFCLNNPGLKATVCDLPATRPFAERTIEKFGLADRVDFKAVDYLQEDIPGTYDVAWLSHILHSEGPPAAQMMIKKAVSALKPGGLIIIHDFILRNTMDGPLFPALFSLNMLLGTREGQSYSEEQIEGMLLAAGVKDIRRLLFKSPNDSGIILGVVK